jgi:FkbM family methyltransferase
MRIGVAQGVRKLSSTHNWRGLFGLLKNCTNPVPIIARYYFGIGTYPIRARLRTPIGQIDLDMYSREDLITLHEVFFREDYGISGGRANGLQVVVDFGANIGIATAYFLTRNRRVRVYSYEPVPRNLRRARENLAGFSDRLELNDCAVGTEDGTVQFGIEDSGRYGGIGLPHSGQIEVLCRRGEAELERILEVHNEIDVLKIDIEGMETPLLRSIHARNLRAIGNIFAECESDGWCLPGFKCDQRLSVATYHRKRDEPAPRGAQPLPCT